MVDVNGPIEKMWKNGSAITRWNVDHFCLRIEPFDPETISQYLDKHGVPYGDTGERCGVEDNDLSIYITDLNLNTVELKTPNLD